MNKTVDASTNIYSNVYLGYIEIALLSVVGAALSICITGFLFGAENNIYHLPIIAKLYNEPQYDNDAFIQSLRYFASGVWITLSGSDKFIDSYWLFVCLHFLSRAIVFIGFLCCATLVGVASRKERLVFVVLLSFISTMREVSYAGEGGLFLKYLTHSEIANGLTLLCLFFAARGRLTASFSINGLVFFVNAFFAVWNAVPLAMIALVHLMRNQLELRHVLLRGAIGLAFFTALAVPVLLNILGNPDFGQPLDFDYRTYLGEYYPQHTLIWSIKPRRVILLLLVLLSGAAALLVFGRRAEPFHAALWGYVLVYAIGVVAPFFTNSPIVLNLHLLRSSTGIHILAALACTSVMTLWVTGEDRLRAKVLGPMLVLSMCTVKSGYAFLLALAILLASYLPLSQLRFLHRVRLDYVVLVILLGVWPWLFWKNVQTNSRIAESSLADWRIIGDWARTSTERDAIFLHPVASNGNEIDSNSGIFLYFSQRRIWVNYKMGAAVMWSPSYYATWRPRFTEVLKLSSLSERIDYASRHNIDYVIDPCADNDMRNPVFRARFLCVFAVDSSSIDQEGPR